MPRCPSTRSQFRRSLAGLCLVPLLLAGGCSGDNGDEGSGTGASAGATTGSPSASEPSRVDAMIATGLQQLQDSQYAEAASTFKEVLRLEPGNAYASYNLGYIAQVQGDEVTAVERYTATLAADKEFAPALYNLGILTESSDLRAAVALYRRDIAVKPDDAPAYMRLGFALRHLGEDQEAEQLLQKGVELDPSMAGVTPPTYQ